jgi:hypothetical protein
MERTENFMGIQVTHDPVKNRREAQKRCEQGLITPRAYWAVLKAEESNMTKEDWDEEFKELNY